MALDVRPHQQWVRVIAAAALALPSILAAQESTRAEIGETVRITAPAVNPKPVIGALWADRTDAVILRTTIAPDDPLVIPKEAIRRAEVRRASAESFMVQGAIAGAVIGAVAGGAWGLELKRKETPGNDGLGIPIPDGAFLAVPGAGLGLVAGGLIGHSIKADRWEELGLPLVVNPTPSGLRLWIR